MRRRLNQRRSLGIVLALGALCGCEATLEADLSESEANEIVVALHEHGIGAAKESEGTGEGARYRVTVAPEEVAPSLEVLRAEALPRERAPGLAEVFGEPGLVPTATEERARYVGALSGELARSVETMERVLEARVHVALPDTRRIALDEARPTPRASVLVRHRGDPIDENAVRALVAGAVQDMTPEGVAVVQVQANVDVPAREANLVRFGPIAVTRGTAGALKGVLAGALGLHLVLAVLVVIGWRRRKLPVPEAPAT
ncbi:MAG: secretion protein [Sandaracinus sp.]|nr:secretion protein [Sandaracinus sp.]MCB9618314.1 secretion protein [Sandaracinus sp.]MCB9636834.1 secretion protein [Sandaracinus sp.]